MSLAKDLKLKKIIMEGYDGGSKTDTSIKLASSGITISALVVWIRRITGILVLTLLIKCI
jgi:hypothetical protein